MNACNILFSYVHHRAVKSIRSQLYFHKTLIKKMHAHSRPLYGSSYVQIEYVGKIYLCIMLCYDAHSRSMIWTQAHTCTCVCMYNILVLLVQLYELFKLRINHFAFYSTCINQSKITILRVDHFVFNSGLLNHILMFWIHAGTFIYGIFFNNTFKCLCVFKWLYSKIILFSSDLQLQFLYYSFVNYQIFEFLYIALLKTYLIFINTVVCIL